jgi:hypothetical protein
MRKLFVKSMELIKCPFARGRHIPFLFSACDNPGTLTRVGRGADGGGGGGGQLIPVQTVSFSL